MSHTWLDENAGRAEEAKIRQRFIHILFAFSNSKNFESIWVAVNSSLTHAVALDHICLRIKYPVAACVYGIKMVIRHYACVKLTISGYLFIQ